MHSTTSPGEPRVIRYCCNPKAKVFLSTHHVYSHAGNVSNKCADLAASLGTFGLTSNFTDSDSCRWPGVHYPTTRVSLQGADTFEDINLLHVQSHLPPILMPSSISSLLVVLLGAQFSGLFVPGSLTQESCGAHYCPPMTEQWSRVWVSHTIPHPFKPDVLIEAH